MAKKHSRNDSKTLHATIVRYALERAGGVVKAAGDAELTPGSYPFALEVSISGELLVEQGSPAGQPETVADIKPAEILAGLVGSVPESEQARMLSEALGAWKNASAEDRKELLARADKVVLAAAKKRKMTTEHATPARKGAVKCKPTVRVHGTAGTNTVELEIAA